MAHRQISDPRGRVWMVWQVTPRAVQVVPWLAFETKNEKRRLTPLPEGWESLTDGELLERLATATPVKARRLIE